MAKTAAACGKFILGGEHSIVYCGRALAFPLPELQLHYQENESKPGLWVNEELKNPEHFQLILKLRSDLGLTKSCLGAEVKSSIPLGGGLGSSAALATALCRYHFPEISGEALARKALEGEKFFHGKSSGIDPYTVALGKAIAFRSQSLEWKEIDLHNFYRQRLCFVLVDSGLRHRTSEVIEQVSRVKKENPLIFEDLMDALSSNVESMLKALVENPLKNLGAQMNDSHFRLIQLGVSTEEIDELCEQLKSQGARGTKLTGAGRGGFVLGLFEEEALVNFRCSQPYLLWKRC